MRRKAIVLLCGLCIIAFTASCARQRTAQQPASPPQAANQSFSPRRVPFSAAHLDRLRVPPGFRVTVFAQGIPNARIMAVGADGTVYVTQPQRDQITALQDRDGDGRAETQRVAVSRISYPHGVTLHQNRMYIAAPQRVYVAELQANGQVGTPQLLADNFPPGGNHPNRTLAVGPDGRLYVSVGSSCNVCVEENREYASIVQMRLDGGDRRVFAGGLRNTIGFAWHPVTGELWGMDQGADGRGPNLPPEELNQIINGRNYGWPWCYGKRQVDTRTPGNPTGSTKAEFCARSEPAVLEYQAHSSPIQFRFYTGSQFPADYRHDAFIAFHGSWNRGRPVGYKVVRVRFNGVGRPTGFDDFLTGFLVDNNTAQFGRPAGIAQLRDGSLLIGDDSNGVIYRVAYVGTR